MTQRIYNFSAGPAVLPVEVLEEARDNILSLGNTGIGIMEHSHRGKAYMAVHEEAEALCRELAGIPDDYYVLFLQGGASLQFSMVPMNLLPAAATADYLVTGAWSQKAVTEARRCGNVHIASSSEDRNFCYIPRTCTFSAQPAYVHFTSNNTIFGTEFASEPDAAAPLVCDASSDIFSRPLSIGKYGLIYAGAQKNLGPSGVTLVIIRKDLVEAAPRDLGTMLQYRTYADDHSLYNTPPTFGIYIMGLVFKWIKTQGGLAAIERANREKAGRLYRYLDESRRFRATADRDSRSLMNVTFVTGDAALDEKFIAAAKRAGLDGLKGHRSVGGMRASLYNAFPLQGVDALLDVMREFEAQGILKQTMAEAAPPPDFTHAEVGIVHATSLEVSPFLSRCDRVRKYTGGDLVFRGGLLGKIRVALAESGMGPKLARRATQTLIDGHSPAWIVSAGFSGALQAGMQVGDIVVASSIVDSSGGELSIDLKMPANPDAGLHVGRLLMVDRMVPTVAEKKSLGAQFGAIAVDMESLAVAQVCREAKTRFLAVRVISDDLSADLPREILSVVNSSGTVRWGAVAGAIFKRFGSAQDLWRLREQATGAAERLAPFLDGVVVQLHGAAGN